MPLRDDISSLILKMLQENITPEEASKLDAWAAIDPANRALIDRLLDEKAMMADTKAFDELWGGKNGMERFNRMEQAVLMKTSNAVKKLNHRWLRYVAAAIVLPLIVTAWLTSDFRIEPSDGVVPTISQTVDIQPGGNRAELTLPNGQTVVLDKWQRGILVGDTLKYTDGSAVLSAVADDALPGTLAPMVISVPHGGQYQVTLSDGTVIWLNAASTLRYPAKFSAEERVVEFEGEGYFVVAHDSDRPFKIVNQRQTIEVLGTEFNLSAYPEETLVRTTLVEGKVTVSFGDPAIRPLHLSPGQQAVVDGSSGHVETVDTAPFTAWKDGFFYFDGDSPESAFAQLGRWYNIEVVYPHHVPNVQFYGKLERNKSLGAILKILEKAGLAFQVVPQDEGYQLIIGGETKHNQSD